MTNDLFISADEVAKITGMSKPYWTDVNKVDRK